jgi:phenylacetate-coenzyme A ligase PaaK-like adenylate-forming protein
MRVQDSRFNALKSVIRAASGAPGYREQFRKSAFAPDDFGRPEDLRRLPILTRDAIREGFPEAFLPPALDAGPSIKRGELRIVRSTAGRKRVEWLNDVEREQRAIQAAIEDQPTLRELSKAAPLRRASYQPIPSAGVICIRDMPAMDLRVDTRFTPALLRLMPPEDPTAPSRREVEKLFLEIESHGAEWLDVYGTYLALATMAALEEGLPIPSVRVITAGLRTLSERHRRLLGETWRCPVIGCYGPAELGAFTMYECDHGALHVNEAFVWWEVLRDGRPAEPGEIGELIVTSLEHRVPLIRYATGELVKVSAGALCPCGSQNGFVESYEGPADEILSSNRGSITTRRADVVLSAIGGIEQYELHQGENGATNIRLRLCPGARPEAIVEAVRSAIASSFDLTAQIEVARIQPHPLTFEFPLIRSSL